MDSRYPKLPRRHILSGTAGAVIATTAASLGAGQPESDALSQSSAAPRERALAHLNPSALAAPRGYTHVVAATGPRTIYVSGQVPLDRTGALVGAGDLRMQTRQVFENIRTALDEAGATFADVAKLTYYVLDASQVQVVRDVRDTFIDTGRPPASTLVEVRRLVREEFLIEVDAIANVRA